MPDKVYRTAIYCRLSREDGDKVESNSIASQRAICEDYIARHEDLELVCEPFVDDGYSGVSFNRPQFKKLEEAIRKGALDCIVVKDLSRFSRNYIDGGRYIEKIFPQLGIRFIAINDAYDSLTGDPQSDSFVIPFKNLINDSYCKDISMKIRSSLEVKQKSGEFVGSFAPYGYMKSPENIRSVSITTWMLSLMIPAQNLQSSKPLIQNLFGAQSFGSWKPTVGKASACHPFMMSWKRNSSKTGLMTSSPGMNRHSGITSIISRIPGRSTGSRNTGGCTTMFLIHRPANRC